MKDNNELPTHVNSPLASPSVPPEQRQLDRRPRRVVRRTAIRTARLPIRLFHSITSGVVKGGKRLVRVNRRGNRLQQQRHHSIRPSPRSLRRRRRRHKRNSSLVDQSVPRNENTPLLSSAEKDLTCTHHSVSTHDTIYETRNVGMNNGVANAQARVLNNVESFLRHILILIIAYLLGAHQSITVLSPYLAMNIGCIVGIAWGTCVVIQVISWFDSADSYPDPDPEALINQKLEQGEDEDSVCTEDDDDDDVDGTESDPATASDDEYGDVQNSYHSDDQLQLKRAIKKSSRGGQIRARRVLPLRRRTRRTAMQKPSFDSVEFEHDEKYAADNEGDRTEDDNIQSTQPSSQNVGRKPMKQHHPELEDLYLVDLISGKRMSASGEPMEIENDLLVGKMLFMSRTSDADLKVKPERSEGSRTNDMRSDYFRGKQRRFELQFQGKFKKAPPSQLYFHCQLKDPIKLGVIQRAFVGATLSFIEKKNKGAFVHNVPGKEPKPGERDEGRYEHPHLTFAVEKAFDRIVKSKEGEQLPVLGTEIIEDPDAVRRRKAGEPIEYNTEDTFTFALWSAYGDFTQWKCVNLPAIRPFSFDSLLMGQNFSMHLYYLGNTNGDTRHINAYQRRYVSFELNNARYCKISEARKNLALVEDADVQESMSLADQEDTFSDNGERVGDILSDSDSSGSDDEQLSFDDEQTGALEELGEGIYLKCGDTVVLREESGGRNQIDSSLTNGGGYATLQTETADTIIIEKIHPKRRKKENVDKEQIKKSPLIRNGDTVAIKLIDTLESVNYLSVRNGWWLKWVKKLPKNSGLFTIHTNDIEDVNGSSRTSSRRSGVETQSSYLRYGGTFYLKSKGSVLEVGVRVSNSAKFGGRVLGLYKNGSYYVTEFDRKAEDENRGSRRQMMMPLKLRVDLPAQSESFMEEDSSPALLTTPRHRPLTTLEEPIEDFRIDAPAWLEIMHRNKRQVYRAYAIRMTRHNACIPDSPGARIQSKCGSVDEKSLVSFLRFRTGQELTPLLRLGLISERNSCGRDENGSDVEAENSHIQNPCKYDLMNSAHSVPTNVAVGAQKKISESYDSDSTNEGDGPYVFSDHSKADSDYDDDAIEAVFPSTPSSSDPRKKKKWIRTTTNGITKVAKGVKTGTIKSGSLIGKAVTHTIAFPIKGHRRSYLRDKPRQTNGKTKSRDHHVAVNKALKNMHSPARQNLEDQEVSNSIIAGQLKPPDQSCRTVSDILSTLSSSPSLHTKALLSAHLSAPADLDLSFLSGGIVELGVVVDTTAKGDPIAEYVVARALWESHWREEACVMHESCIDFYSPLSSKISFSIPFYDIQRVRRVDNVNDRNPVVGHHMLAVETAWECHYLAFSSEEMRTDFFNILNVSIFSNGTEVFQRDEWHAHMWQGVQSSTDTCGESAKWAGIGSSRKQRIILNSRRMSFDCDTFGIDESSEKDICSFVQKLLKRALSISLENLVSNPKNFIQFLDDTSRLRQLPFSDIKKNGAGAFCLCVNIYHCLLQHALLLSKTGPPTKKNVVNFMRTHCYEIGGDVFSLAELESCVIRGNMPKSYYPKQKAHKTSRGHFAYALDYIDPRVIFVLNTGLMSHPSEIPVLDPDHLEEQLTFTSELFLKNHVKVDPVRRVVTLPKICDIYRNDFDGGAKTCVEYCLRFLDEGTRSELIEMLDKSSNLLTFRYEHSCDKYHSTLQKMKFNGIMEKLQKPGKAMNS